MSNLIGYVGMCGSCKEEQRAYYYYADSRRRAMMINGTFPQERSNCPKCVTSKIFLVAKTVKWGRRLSQEEVKRDLQKHTEGGIAIDFDAVDRQIKSDVASEKWLENNAKRVDEVRAYRKSGRKTIGINTP